MNKFTRISFSSLFASIAMLGSFALAADTSQPSTTNPASTTPTTPSVPAVPSTTTPPTTPAPSTDLSLMKLLKCAPDVKEFCTDITPGKGREFFCLKAHDDKISTPCREQLHAILTEMQEIHKACKADVQNFCKDIQPGEGKIMNCLKQHQSELSTECKTQMADMPNSSTANTPPSSTTSTPPSPTNS